MDPQLKSQLKQQIRVAARSGVNTDGTADYSAPAARYARVEPSRKVVPGANGAVLTTSYCILVEAEIGILDRVWLPGTYTSADDGRARVPMQVEQLVDENGRTDHWEIYL